LGGGGERWVGGVFSVFDSQIRDERLDEWPTGVALTERDIQTTSILAKTKKKKKKKKKLILKDSLKRTKKF
jgi:hypothetical protein